jgi:hypothetical protein
MFVYVCMYYVVYIYNIVMGLFLNVFSYCSYVSIIYICLYPIRMLNLFIFIGLYIPLGTRL